MGDALGYNRAMSERNATELRRNIELKARVLRLDEARRMARQVATSQSESQQQTDTYFRCPSGRLKLREINRTRSELIWYQRPSVEAAKPSDYCITRIEEPEKLRTLLSCAYGIEAVVSKNREIYLHHNVRIHLDEVEGLGSFIEFEAVMSSQHDDEHGHRQLRTLSEKFGIAPSDLQPASYGELVDAHGEHT